MTNVKLKLKTDTDILLMIEKKIIDGICHFHSDTPMLIMSIWKKKCNKKIKNSSFLLHWDVNNWYVWFISQCMDMFE